MVFTRGHNKDVDMISNDFLNAGFSPIEVCTTLVEAHLPNKTSELLLSVLAQGAHVDEQLLLDVLQTFGQMSPNSSTKYADTGLPLEAYISVIGEYGKQRLLERKEALKCIGGCGISLPFRLLTEQINGLIEEFDKALQALHSSREGAGLGLTNVILDLLWAFQKHGAFHSCNQEKCLLIKFGKEPHDHL
ncbi:hypothetical protein GOP47_0016945 [Adiantum capillus-veneris]|uniref:Uncharacterized protein n=1 Tax=Adiantum capillus-veneris TaxID=13818 RepID=A0A9D4UIP4_ADICA|nr:hypothetical protein GOP47_0016945 [Adiantum capillus-veneris]